MELNSPTMDMEIFVNISWRISWLFALNQLPTYEGPNLFDLPNLPKLLELILGISSLVFSRRNPHSFFFFSLGVQERMCERGRAVACDQHLTKSNASWVKNPSFHNEY